MRMDCSNTSTTRVLQSVEEEWRNIDALCASNFSALKGLSFRVPKESSSICIPLFQELQNIAKRLEGLRFELEKRVDAVECHRMAERLALEEEWKQVVQTINVICKYVQPLYARIPALVGFIDKLTKSADEMVASTADTNLRQSVCFFVRAAFEACLDEMLRHAGHAIVNESDGSVLSLSDRVLTIKPYFSTIRINCFFELKELASTGLHTTTSSEISVKQIRRILIAFQSVLEECSLFLMSPAPARMSADSKAHDTVSIVEPLYKTVLCRHYRKGFCQFGNKCRFAHGEGQLRKTGMI